MNKRGKNTNKKRTNGKLIVFIILLGIIASALPATAVPTIVKISDASVGVGQTVTVPVEVFNILSVGAANIYLTYDNSVVKVTGVSEGDLGNLTYNIDNPNGTVKIGWFSAYGHTGEFVYANVILEALGNIGDTSPLDIDVKELVDANGVPILPEVYDGIFTILDPSNVVTVSINDASELSGSSVTIPIMINDVENAGATGISLTYDPSVVHVTAVDGSDFDFMDADIQNSSGDDKISAFQMSNPGLSGNVKLADITFKAVGGPGKSSTLKLIINELKESGAEEIDILATADDGFFVIKDPQASENSINYGGGGGGGSIIATTTPSPTATPKPSTVGVEEGPKETPNFTSTTEAPITATTTPPATATEDESTVIAPWIWVIIVIAAIVFILMLVVNIRK